MESQICRKLRRLICPKCLQPYYVYEMMDGALKSIHYDGNVNQVPTREELPPDELLDRWS